MRNLLTTLLLMLATNIHAQSAQEVRVEGDSTYFSLFAPPKAKNVRVHIYAAADSKKPLRTIRLAPPAADSLWKASVGGDLTGRYYTFQVDRMKECPGIFAKAVGEGGRRGYIVNLRDTDPEGWGEDRRPAIGRPVDHIIYELHHRDFSMDGGFRYPGKFLALTEPKAIQHLKRLGINAVHILPSFDFASIDESHPDKPQYNWGYDPLNYNVPEGSYATDAATPEVRIREFKQMVQALHSAGIRVVLDVVYNHTMDTENSNFHLTYPGYYFRHRADGTASDGSGCGNETASEKPHTRQFMVESVCYWAREYHIDGFRFDLMGIHDIETMKAIRGALTRIDPTILIYGEGWSAGDCAIDRNLLAMKAVTYKMPGVAAFCDDMRDALRGPFSDDTRSAFLGGESGHEESIKYGIAGCIAHPQIDMAKVNYSERPFASEPGQAVMYVSCHDDMCLVDRLRASVGEDIELLDMLAQTAVFTSQGIPFMLAGEEVMRDKKGVHNSYCSPDSINTIDWSGAKRHRQVFDYYRGLIALRKAHPAFRLGDAGLVRQHLEFLDTSSDCVVAFRLKDLEGIDTWSEIVVVLNGNRVAVEQQVPEGWWTIVAADGRIDLSGLAVAAGERIVVPGRSAMIIYK